MSSETKEKREEASERWAEEEKEKVELTGRGER